MNQITFANCIAIFVFIVFLIGILKNFSFFFISKNKVYLAFALFLLAFISIFINKRLFKLFFSEAPAFLEYLDFLLLTLASGATVYLARYFLSLTVLTKFSVFYFLGELLFSIITYISYMMGFKNPILGDICLLLVAIYAFYLLLVIVSDFISNNIFFLTNKKVHYLIFILLHVSNIVLCFSLLNPKYNLLPFFLYIEIILIIFYLDFFILLRPTAFYQARANNENTVNNSNKHFSFPENEEREIIEMILAGKSYKEISFELKIPFNTVKKKISHLYKKYNVMNKNQLMALFYKE